MKKLVKMLNSGSSKLDEILSTGKTDKEHFGLGYTGHTGSGQTVFVKGTSSGVNVEEDMKGKRAAGTPIRTHAIVNSGKANVATPNGTPGRMRRRKWIPTCHYCNKRGHIRPRCFQLFADLRRASQERLLPRKPVKQEWVKKSESKCNMARSSLKDVEDINIQEKIFLGKHIADM